METFVTKNYGKLWQRYVDISHPLKFQILFQYTTKKINIFSNTSYSINFILKRSVFGKIKKHQKLSWFLLVSMNTITHQPRCSCTAYRKTTDIAFKVHQQMKSFVAVNLRVPWDFNECWKVCLDTRIVGKNVGIFFLYLLL